MKTPMPASPFLSDSVGLHPLPTDEAAPMMPPLRGAADQFSSATSPSSVADTAAASKTPAPASDAAATNSSLPGDLSAPLYGEREPSVMLASSPGETAVAWSSGPLYATATNSSFTAGGPQRALPAVADPHETGGALGFKLDEAAFMEAIEANPLFLKTFPLNARVADSIDHRAFCNVPRSPDHGEG